MVKISRRRDVPQPPDAPRIRRRVRFSPLQALGILLILGLPLLALLGVFGESSREAEAHTAALRVHLRYPDRFRFEQIGELLLFVDNTSSRPLDSVRVEFDSFYVNRFSQVTFTPAAEQAYRVRLARLEPGATGLVAVELQGEHYGRHRGAVRVAAGADTAALGLSTLVFP
ncbi:MAG: hypothetical protein HY561_02885 [Gemmatimonadetes bacterium]|nr:hypothetical protein [Gemmatimonadota bacterium]